MALTPAEKQRIYRQRRDSDPEKRKAYLMKIREKYKEDIEVGKRKLVADMSSREHRAQKKSWRTKQRNYREKNTSDSDKSMTPQTPDETNKSGITRQRIQGQRKVLCKIATCYRENETLKQRLSLSEKKADLYKKRYHRVTKSKGDTPRSKTKKLLRCFSTKVVRRTLTFHHAVMAQLKKSYKSQQKPIRRILAGNIIRKYKFITRAKAQIGASQRQGTYTKTGSISKRMQKKVESYFERDDVSRITTGKKLTVTKQKVKKQKRLLNDTIYNSYRKFKSETNERISFTTFWRLKPFWVKSPRASDRQTCNCKTCDNMSLLVSALVNINALDTPRLYTLVHRSVCSTKNKDCMYGVCEVCKDQKVPMSINDANEKVSWKQWTGVKEERELKSGEIKQITLKNKEEQSRNASDLSQHFQQQMSEKYRKHHFNIVNQFQYYKYLRENMELNECLVHIDFAENYVGKLASEIQSRHFGASTPKITLHTGYYSIGNSEKVATFSAVSDCFEHNPASIWAFMMPVLKEIRNKHPSVDVIHFFSDGPTSQYRQKANFFLFSTEIFGLGFRKAAWNFHESGHGKGIPDGVGGTLKRSADQSVSYGADISDAASFVHELTCEAKTDVTLFRVDKSCVKQFSDKLKSQELKPVPGTMKIHQVVTTNPNVILYRDVSCKHYANMVLASAPQLTPTYLCKVGV